MFQELLQDVLAWPIFVIAFLAVGYVLLRVGDFISDAWSDWKDRAGRWKRK